MVRVTNGKRFSYPGYNELLAGHADDRIDSNDKIPNPNVTVLEWLNRRPRSEGSGGLRLLGCASFIVNRDGAGSTPTGTAPR